MSVSRIPIKLKIQGIGTAEGELIRLKSPRTTDAIIKALPIEGMSAVWQEEVYFDIPIKMGNEKSSATVEKGDLAYWPMGAAFCIFWGETQPYSPINKIGKVTKNLELFEKVQRGTKIFVEKI
ncbi:MAG: cyclophilin-like fold protein [Candidatus Bathyarchaeota archaeon]